ncbi:MAG TPA: serine hydrolase [Pyrinomonadaceae bacterium]|nr:serine hydrolase [Pyrinomonadaceae bacterium]
MCSLTLLTVFSGTVLAQKIEIVKPATYRPSVMTVSPALKETIDAAVAEVLSSQQGFKNEEIAVTVIDLSDANKFHWAEHRGEAAIYPASVVKIFFMAALERQLEDKKVTMTPELERGLKDMIVDSSNEATQYILDVLTNTASGAEMPQKEFDAWQYKRNRVNRWFSSMGYTNINVNQKTFCEDAYGIEQQSRAYKGQNRNMITTNATARLMAEIVTGNLNTPERTARMMNLMKRDPFAAKDPNSQATDFTGKLLIDRKMTDARLWSKAGWTSRARHDVAYIETGDGLKFVIAIYTENHANKKEVIPAVVGKVIEGLRSR